MMLMCNMNEWQVWIARNFGCQAVKKAIGLMRSKNTGMLGIMHQLKQSGVSWDTVLPRKHPL